MKRLKLGIIGLDTSHAVAFIRLLHDEKENHHVAGARVALAFPGGSPHLPISRERLEGFTAELMSHPVPIAKTMEEVAEKSDAILLESVDGGVHLEQFRKIVPYRKPVFIDKPLALTSHDAEQIVLLAKQYNTPIMSSSALRFAEGLTTTLQKNYNREIIGADCFGPMEIIEDQPGLFWYGIHTIEMLYTIMGCGAKRIQSISNQNHDVLQVIWKDGRMATIRGNRAGNNQFGAIIHYKDGSEFVEISPKAKPYYASLLEEALAFFREGKTRVSIDETLEIIRFMEAANRSREIDEMVFI
ncbi:Gfo/Idh/MocA family protein [Ornithinibacillus scapharcae]|uniref:Gfo/Idh/MocA family protein n=1 Tax=Ornithinibacillus scapharcae TaxID=1147159 RepID=UPI000225AA8E|nr:Gfo/Idh/MocA family oxidoreductase [Ornithinibacillus scapharcae]